MAIAGYYSSTRRALNPFVRGAVTDRFDRNLHVLRFNIDVTVAYMDDLDAAVRYLQELLSDWSVSSNTGPVPLRAPSPLHSQPVRPGRIAHGPVQWRRIACRTRQAYVNRKTGSGDGRAPR